MGLPEQVYPSYIINKQKCNEREITDAPKLRKGGALRGKEVLRLVKHDMIRELLVPSEDPNIYPAVMDKNEYERIKAKAQEITLQKKVEKLQELEAKRNRMMSECLLRKEQFQKYDLQRMEKSAALLGLNEAEPQRTNYALTRAYELRQEGDDDMKQFNKVILGSKCLAIRDAQVQEKRLIKCEMEAEEHRLDDMMEQIRRTGLKQEQEQREADIARRRDYIKHLLEQIKENEIAKELEAERLEEESRRLQEANIQLQIEEIDARKKHLDQQEQRKCELTEVNKQLQHFRDLEQEEERVEILKMQEFQRQRAKWEEARERELKAQALAHNQEFSKLWTLQEKQKDTKKEFEELHEQRVRDEAERLWRQREQEEARKKHNGTEQLKADREAQVEDHRRMKALEMAREKQEYDVVLQTQHKLNKEHKMKELKRLNDLQQYRKDLLCQMNQKERERIRAKQESFEENQAMRLESELHEKQIKDLMHKKVGELRMYNVPEPHIKKVESQIKTNTQKKFSV